MKSEELEQLIKELKPWEKEKGYFSYLEFITELNKKAPRIPKPILIKSKDRNPEFRWGSKIFNLFPGYVQLELFPVQSDHVMIGYTLGHFKGSNVEGVWDRTNNYFDCWVIISLVEDYA